MNNDRTGRYSARGRAWLGAALLGVVGWLGGVAGAEEDAVPGVFEPVAAVPVKREAPKSTPPAATEQEIVPLSEAIAGVKKPARPTPPTPTRPAPPAAKVKVLAETGPEPQPIEKRPAPKAQPPAPPPVVTAPVEPAVPVATSQARPSLPVTPNNPPAAEAAGEAAGPAVAVFAGRAIGKEELYRALLQAHGPEVFSAMIDRALLATELQRRGVAVAREEIEKTFARHEAKYRAQAGEKADFSVVIRDTYGMTVAEYQDQVVWSDCALSKLTEQELSISDADLFNYFYSNQDKYTQPEEVRVSHILISPLALSQKSEKISRSAGPEEWKLALEKILEIQDRLRAGANFAALAKEFSHDTKSGARGGDLGFFARGVMLKPFEDAAFALPVGGVSDVVKTIYGYHLLTVTDRTQSRPQAFGDIKDQVRADYREYMTSGHAAMLLGQLRLRAQQDGRLKILEPLLQRGP